MSDDNVVINKLEDILENETTYDSDGVASGQSPARPPSSSGSVGSSGSVASSGNGSRGKRRTWKKPKDKPKRPLSAYNIFFKHERSRIVEGLADVQQSPQEIVCSVEQILSTSRETRRHRKTHGRISFGDLARKIAEKWKTVDKERKAVFEHYAGLDMRRYRKELKIWKDGKDQLAFSGSMHEKLNNSVSSLDIGAEDESEVSLDQLGPSNHSRGSRGGHYSASDAWGARYSMNSSFSSIDSAEISLEPIPINEMMRNSRISNNGSRPLPGMEVGVPVPGVVPSNGFQQMNVNNPMQNIHNMQTMQNMPNVPIPNMQPGEVALFNQQQLLLSNMQFGPMAQQGQNMKFGPMQPMAQQGQNMNVTPMDLQQQRMSLEEQRNQLMVLQQQQQLLQQQLIQQQNNLRMQQGNLVNQQASFAFVQQQQGVAQPHATMSQPVMNRNAAQDETSSEPLFENFNSNLDLSKM
jgi:hypothetical protein